MGGLPGCRHQGRGPAPCRVPHAALAPARRGRRSRAAQAAGDRLRQLHPDRRGARLRRRPGDGVEDHRVEPLERGRDGHPWRPLRRRRPHRHLRLGGLAVRDRLQPLLPRQGGGRLRRPAVRAGPRLPRHLRPRLPRRPASASSSSTTSARRRAATVCPPTRTRGGCPGCGSSPRSPWASARSRRSTRRASTATSPTATSRTRRTRTSGPSWATARWTSPSRPPPSRWRPASSSTT